VTTVSSTSGYSRTGRLAMPWKPRSRMKAASTVESTGRRMKISEKCMGPVSGQHRRRLGRGGGGVLGDRHPCAAGQAVLADAHDPVARVHAADDLDEAPRPPAGLHEDLLDGERLAAVLGLAVAHDVDRVAVEVRGDGG